jgi:hypothetical protein
MDRVFSKLAGTNEIDPQRGGRTSKVTTLIPQTRTNPFRHRVTVPAFRRERRDQSPHA